MKVLVLTVGGSHAPLLTAIESIKPDRVVFMCSDDIDKFKGSYAEVEGEGMVLCSNGNTMMVGGGKYTLSRFRLMPGAEFVVVAKNDVLLFKQLSAPRWGQFDSLIREARRQARVAGLTRRRVKQAVAKLRSGR